MRLRHGGEDLDLDRASLAERLPNATAKVLVLVHGSSMNDAQWRRRGHDHGAALAGDLGYTPIYVGYNSGLHISTNGRELATLLDRLARAWPVPIDEIALLGHSMGGLLTRSACHAAEADALEWRSKLHTLISLGTPHLGISRYSAPLARLGKIRSAGVTDLRFGNLLDEHWEGRDRFAMARDPRRALELPANVGCHAIAATRSPEGAAKLRSDGMVPIDSALGEHLDPALDLGFPDANRWIGFEMDHLDLLDRPEVYARIVSCLGGRPARVEASSVVVTR
jgi:pimeloyl-ACP methyl ester carboxylesterase